MNSAITTGKQQAVDQAIVYSQDYSLIRNEVESKWLAWKVLTHNANFAISAHAKS
jgi:hypothetical protein